jgi:5'-3' exonuclease
MKDKNLLIIDGLNMFLRSYVVNPTMTPKGHPIGGCIGFIKSLQKVCGMFTPDEIIVAWDGHSGSAKRKEMNKEYKDGRKPVRFNRRMIELNPEDEKINKAEQYIKLVEYLNESPIIQIVVDYVEADDIIAFACQHDKYRDYHKYIISSDRDFFQLVGSDVSLYRPIQKKLVNFENLMDEHGIHPNNFALARAIAGDKSDNLPGIPRAGLKTIKKYFPFVSGSEIQTTETIAEHCRKVDKPLKIHQNILAGLDRIENNYDVMQLYKPVIGSTSKRTVDFSIREFEPEWKKINFQKYLMRDGQITLKLDTLYASYNKIILDK